MKRLKWLLKQLLLFKYKSAFTEDKKRKRSVWRMWPGRCFAINTTDC